MIYKLKSGSIFITDEPFTNNIAEGLIVKPSNMVFYSSVCSNQIIAGINKNLGRSFSYSELNNLFNKVSPS
jgi:hypothetical protein